MNCVTVHKIKSPFVIATTVEERRVLPWRPAASSVLASSIFIKRFVRSAKRSLVTDLDISSECLTRMDFVGKCSTTFATLPQRRKSDASCTAVADGGMFCTVKDGRVLAS